MLAVVSFHQAAPVTMGSALLGDFRGACAIALDVWATDGLRQELLMHASNNEGAKSLADWTQL